MAKLPKDRSKREKINHEQLGQMLQNIYESGYIDRNTMYKMSFFKGVVAGLGSVIGATIVFALVLWILSLFDTLPLIDDIVRSIQNSVDVKKP